MAFEPAHKLLETASEAILISSSSSEVKPETWTFTTERLGTSENAVSEREREALTRISGAILARARFFVDATYVTGVVAFARLHSELLTANGQPPTANP